MHSPAMTAAQVEALFIPSILSAIGLLANDTAKPTVPAGCENMFARTGVVSVDFCRSHSTRCFILSVCVANTADVILVVLPALDETPLAFLLSSLVGNGGLISARLAFPATCTAASLAAGEGCLAQLTEPTSHTTVQVALDTCPGSYVPYVSINCAGGYCDSIFKPCTGGVRRCV